MIRVNVFPMKSECVLVFMCSGGTGGINVLACEILYTLFLKGTTHKTNTQGGIEYPGHIILGDSVMLT